MEIQVVDFWNFNPSLLCRQMDLIYPVAPRRAKFVEYVMCLPRAMGKTVALPRIGHKVIQVFQYAIQPRVMPTIKWMKYNARKKQRFWDDVAKGYAYAITSPTSNRTYSLEKIPYYKKNGMQSW